MGGGGDVTIYHNPACGTSRRVLDAIRARGITPRVVEYLKTPPDEATLRDLLTRMGLPPSGLLRRKGALWQELGLDAPGVTEEAILAAILAHPALMERPVVVGPRGAVALCRPPERLEAVLGPAAPG
jgi:arsenate reductase (glutaredoxin)